MGLIRSWLSLLPIALLLACGGSGSLPGPEPADDDDGGLEDDDDSGATDDDDVGPDDDDVAPDDDDIAPDDDDFWPDDDDIAPDDDDAVPPECPSSGTLECGLGVASNNGGGATDLESYACVGGGMTGPEVTFSIEPGSTAWYQVTMTGLSDDLDLYLLAGDQCDGAACIEGSWGPGTSDEEFWFEGIAGDSYILVVDGWDGAISDFVLEVSCETGDDDDAADDDDAVDDDDVEPDDDDATGVDSDGDGYDDTVDCDDTDPLINPGAADMCDSIDNDCDGSIDPSCPDCTQAEFGGHTYQICGGFGGFDWTSSRDTCAVYGYYLATINEQAEQDFLAAEALAAVGDSVWIGYNDRGWGNEGTFTWTAGNGSGFEAWSPGEPNNSGNEDCVEMRADFGYLWNDINCSATTPWICEVDR